MTSGMTSLRATWYYVDDVVKYCSQTKDTIREIQDVTIDMNGLLLNQCCTIA